MEIKSLQSAELELSLDLQNENAWHTWQMIVESTYGKNIPEKVQRTSMFFECLRSEFNPLHLNKLAASYDKNSPFIATLCRLVSLIKNPTQSQVYGMAQSAYDSKVLLPTKFQISEPETCMISVITPTHNRPYSLKVALASVLSQTFQDYEIVVINNGGDASAQEVVNSFNSKKIRYLYEGGLGQYKATNTGIRASCGRYITYLDDDDIYYPNHLEKLHDALQSKNLSIIVGSNRWVVGEWQGKHWVEKRDLTIKYKKGPTSEEIASRLHNGCVISNLDVLHERTLFEKSGLYLEEPERGADWEFWVRLSKYVKYQRIVDVTCEVRVPGIIPRNSPASAQFYSNLWPLYFGSAYGELALGLAAFHHGEYANGIEHFARIDSGWQYLNQTSLDALWSFSNRHPGVVDDYVWEYIAEYHPVWLANRILIKNHPIMNWPQLPAKIYWKLISKTALYVLSNPKRSLGTLMRRRYNHSKK
jgi:glycosyltransferase involved in cell wall biosynthesis